MAPAASIHLTSVDQSKKSNQAKSPESGETVSWIRRGGKDLWKRCVYETKSRIEVMDGESGDDGRDELR